MSVEPLIGRWYQDLEREEIFEVVAVEDDTIEIQYFDGTVEELDWGVWDEIQLDYAEPPEDWTAPYDELEMSDLGYDDRPMHPEDWSPLTLIEGPELDEYR